MYIMYRAWTSLATINSFPLAGDAARLLDPNLLCIHCFVSSSAMSCETRVVSPSLTGWSELTDGKRTPLLFLDKYTKMEI